MAIQGSYLAPKSAHVSKKHFQENVGDVEVTHMLCSPSPSPSEESSSVEGNRRTLHSVFPSGCHLTSIYPYTCCKASQIPFESNSRV